MGGVLGKNAWTDLHLSLQLPSTTLTASRSDPWCRLVWKPSGLVLKQESSSGPRASFATPPPSPLPSPPPCCCPQVLPSGGVWLPLSSLSAQQPLPPHFLCQTNTSLTLSCLWSCRLMRAGQGAGFVANASTATLLPPPSSQELGPAPGICVGFLTPPSGQLLPPATSPTLPHWPGS